MVPRLVRKRFVVRFRVSGFGGMGSRWNETAGDVLSRTWHRAEAAVLMGVKRLWHGAEGGVAMRVARMKRARHRGKAGV